MSDIGISVIIPTIERPKYLEETVRCALRQEIDVPFEIIVIDQSKEYNKAFSDLYSNDERIRYFHRPYYANVCKARNEAMTFATFEYIIFLDDDVSFGETFFREHLSALSSSPEIGIVGGRIIELKEERRCNGKTGYYNYYLAVALPSFSDTKPQYIRGIGGGNFSIKKTAFYLAGGSDENLCKGTSLFEETDLCLRVSKQGYLVYFNPKAEVSHFAAPSGGVRSSKKDEFLSGYMHNRCLMIARHSSFFQSIFAHAYSFRIMLSFSIKIHNMFLLYLKAYRLARHDYLSGISSSFCVVQTKDLCNE